MWPLNLSVKLQYVSHPVHLRQPPMIRSGWTHNFDFECDSTQRLISLTRSGLSVLSFRSQSLRAIFLVTSSTRHQSSQAPSICATSRDPVIHVQIIGLGQGHQFHAQLGCPSFIPFIPFEDQISDLLFSRYASIHSIVI